MLNTEILNQVGLITLARPWAYNVINPFMINEIVKTFNKWQANNEVKMIMITGEGDIFCHGLELGDVEKTSVEELSDLLQDWGKLLDLIYHYPKVTVALINGKTQDTGCELAAVCDFRLAHADVHLCFDHFSHRLTSNYYNHVHYLLKRLSYPKGLELICTGRELTGAEAYSLGFIDKILPKSNFLEEAFNWSKPFLRHKLKLLEQYKAAALKWHGYTCR